MTCPSMTGYPNVGCIVYSLVAPCIEALKRLIGVERFPQLCVVCCEVRGKYYGVVAIDMDDQEERCCARVSHKRVIEGGEIVSLIG